MSHLLDHFHRIRDTASPECVPDPIDLAPYLTSQHVEFPSSVFIPGIQCPRATPTRADSDRSRGWMAALLAGRVGRNRRGHYSSHASNVHSLEIASQV